jgi:hypothetical protein
VTPLLAGNRARVRIDCRAWQGPPPGPGSWTCWSSPMAPRVTAAGARGGRTPPIAPPARPATSRAWPELGRPWPWPWCALGVHPPPRSGREHRGREPGPGPVSPPAPAPRHAEPVPVALRPLPLPRLPVRERGLHAPVAGRERRLPHRTPDPVARSRPALSAHQRGYGAAHRAARLIVLARDGYTCQWCGGPATEADHLGAKVPDPDTMVAACRTCNGRRGWARMIALRGRRPSRVW